MLHKFYTLFIVLIAVFCCAVNVKADGYTLSIYLSREDIASMSNMTTSNAIRTLSSFAMENIIMIDGRKIRIMQDEELRKVSKLG